MYFFYKYVLIYTYNYILKEKNMGSNEKWNINSELSWKLNDWLLSSEEASKLYIEYQCKLNKWWLKTIIISKENLKKLRDLINNNNQSIKKYNRMTWTDWRIIKQIAKSNKDNDNDKDNIDNSISLTALVNSWQKSREIIQNVDIINSVVSVKDKEKIKAITWQKFDFEKYKKIIAKKESWKQWYMARNDALWKKKWISYKKWAFWKYQFTVETLLDYWFDLRNNFNNWINKNNVKIYFDNNTLQENIMERFTNKNLNRALRNKKFVSLFKKWSKNITKALWAWHIWWYWGLIKYMRWEFTVDWLWTSSDSYVNNMWSENSTILA